jgi:phosphatidylserine/phosphatidylglycerophosphate/cardiolipin synthase-like enzyme
MHDMRVVADEKLVLTGGRHIGDQDFQFDPNSHCGDDDVAVYGPIVQRLSNGFDEAVFTYA